MSHDSHMSCCTNDTTLTIIYIHTHTTWQCYTSGGRPYLLLEDVCPLVAGSTHDSRLVPTVSALLRLAPSVTVPWDPFNTGSPSDGKLPRFTSPLYCREVSVYFDFASDPIGCNLFFASPGLGENKENPHFPIYCTSYS